MRVVPVSALNGRGVDDLLDNLVTQLPPPKTREHVQRTEPVDMAVIGKPNAGKSSVINAILGEDRQVGVGRSRSLGLLRRSAAHGVIITDVCHGGGWGE